MPEYGHEAVASLLPNGHKYYNCFRFPHERLDKRLLSTSQFPRRMNKPHGPHLRNMQVERLKYAKTPQTIIRFRKRAWINENDHC